MTDAPVPAIEEYGLVGNLETCALVSTDGSIDWFPYPHIESPSIFAAILDPDVGGRFRISPSASFESSQQYVDRTNVLETTFHTDAGTATVTDFMPPAEQTDAPKKVLYRKLTCTDGSVDLEAEFAPRFDYGRAVTTLELTDEGAYAEGTDERTALVSPVSLDRTDRVTATGTVELEANETAWFILRCTGAEDADTDPEAVLEATVNYWDDWIHTCGEEGADCVFQGPWHTLAVRSGLVLKLLTHHESGAVAAAPTTSLPEDIGGVRNWDYRFNWIRDAAFTIQALSNLGHTEEAVSYFNWFLDLCHADEPAKIQPLYGLHGDTDLTERTLDEFAGYRNSQPVRIGNEAADQRQLDIYGELLLAVDEMLQHEAEIDADDWAAIRDIVEYVRDVWTEKDAGIWEVRGGPEHFVYSKVMCWVAFDRGIDIATEYGFDAPVEEWTETRETIKTEVLDEGYDEDVGSFVQSFGSDALDATGLLIPIVGFLPFDDERVQGTIDAIDDRLATDDGLVHRYDGDDGLPGDEGAFVLCSCWLVDALALSGRIEAAWDRFDMLTEYVSPLGLVAEELDPGTKTHLGNFPQAFSHIGLINSALYLGHADGYEQPGPPPMGIRLGDPDGVNRE